MIYKEIEGDLIELAKAGHFDVIAHGCNCFCRMKRGIAPQMVKAFGVDKFLSETTDEGDVDKLGSIDWDHVSVFANKELRVEGRMSVVNAYTQYHWTEPGPNGIPLDYHAMAMCFAKINADFKGEHLGIPRIGCGLAGGDWEKVKELINQYLSDMKQVTVVNLKS